MNTRALAADILVDVAHAGKSLSSVLEQNLPGIAQATDRSFIQALTYGVVRWYWQLDGILDQLTRKPIKDETVRMLALLGLYQLRYMRVKPHAAVSETVKAAGGKTWAKPLLNGVLRTYQREQARLDRVADEQPFRAYSHPEWLVNQLRKDWPEDWPALLDHNNAPPPLTLRVNRLRQTRADVIQRLAEQGIAATASTVCDSALTLDQPMAVDAIPGFSEGHLSVQDTAAQLAAGLMQLAPGLRVLDLCAAPGGKTAHLLEACPELAAVVAVDISTERLARVRQNLDRIGLEATLITGDATRPDTWWDGRPFDRILVDAPCSATGVIRRHPDIKLLRQPGDIAALARTQQAILRAVWPLLAPGGVLVYATCSVLRRENEATIAEFLGQQGDAFDIPIEADWGLPAGHGRQILTGHADMDGFYYARLGKTG